MNRLNSRNRKLVYMGGILVLLIPIAVLGMPATERSSPTAPAESGGTIARLRHDYKLGETTLGDVDPASATMNLVLLGMRGIAASMLWMQADQQKDTKNWSELEQTVESIIKLQPRFLQVWKYQGWNLAFNVSSECDAVADRYFWVKKGAKFMIRGTKQNEDAAELYHQTGEFFGKKIGRSDEHVQFRQFFNKSDPDPRWNGRPDEDINPDGEDNYLVAKGYYETANQKEELPGVEQHIMARSLFRAYPGRSQMDYATALQSEGTFDEVSLEAWREGHNWWTGTYGRESFTTPGGEVMLGATEEDLERLVANDPNTTLDDKRHWLDRYQKMTNYPYWRDRSEVESLRATVDARRKLYQGKERFFAVDLKAARTLLEEGLKEMEPVLAKYPDLLLHSETIEDVLKSQLMWQHVLRLYDEAVPQNFPLRNVWDNNPAERADLEERFQQRVNAADISTN
ncbi:MAG: hypothetical protein KF861_14620 [Planctomycetaceae bacterium]|nr:hypothetical protein [Planctomycetaceae bacterium]